MELTHSEGLLMMIWFALDDGASTIELLNEDETHHLV